MTDGCKRQRSQKPPASQCIKPRPVCSTPRKAHLPVRERAIPRGTTAGSGVSHSVGKSGRNYFGTHVEQLYERNEASARGRYICDFLERERGNHTEIDVVTPDTPPTPGGPGSKERTTTLVPLETSVGGLGTPPTPGDKNLEERDTTPTTQGTQWYGIPWRVSLGRQTTYFHHLHQAEGKGGTPVKARFCLLLFRQRMREIHPLRLDAWSRRLTGLRDLLQSCKPMTLK